jgi:hypothetical protein
MTEPHQPPADGDWLAWADTHYPFDPKWETILLTRSPEHRATPQSQSELNDLRGLRDRNQAAMMASVWYNIRTKSAVLRARECGTTTRELDALDEAITGRY